MHVLLIGSGGREHALACTVEASPGLTLLTCLPGNPGTQAMDPKRVSHLKGVDMLDGQAILHFCLDMHVDLVIIGPEAPLAAGVADVLRKHGVAVLGPGQAGARLEGSKVFSKAFMLRHGVPTAPARIFSAEQIEEARAYVAAHPLPVVIKADGLAAGKGVVVAQTHAEALEALQSMLVERRFGASSEQILVEEFMPGIEASCFVLTDGNSYMMLPEAKDYKRIGVGDTGPNTGGMGAISPVPFYDAAFAARVEQTIILPTLAGLRSEGIPYRGFLFIGLMQEGGIPRVVEYNCRLGDPETQVILPRLAWDLLLPMFACSVGRLEGYKMLVRPEAACTVVLASGGYPEAFTTELPITGLEATPPEGVSIYQAGTRQDEQGVLRTSGGRVMAVTGLGADLAQARARAYTQAEQIHFEGKYYRPDVGAEF